MDKFYGFLGKSKARQLRLALMDMWKAFRNSTSNHNLHATILFGEFRILPHLGEALHKVRKHEYARQHGRPRFRRGLKNQIREIERRDYGLHDKNTSISRS